MHLSEILKPGAVRSLAQVTSKKRLFQELSELAQSEYGLNASEVLDALQERESLGRPGLARGWRCRMPGCTGWIRSWACSSGWKSRWISTLWTASRSI